MTGSTLTPPAGIRRFMDGDSRFFTFGRKLSRPRRSNTRLGKVARKWFGKLSLAWELAK